MPPPNPNLRVKVIKALHTLKNQTKAIEKVAATPGANRAEVTILVEETMAANRRNARIVGLVLIVAGVAVGLLVWVVLVFTGRLFYVVAIGAPVLVFTGLYKLVLPSSYSNSELEAAEKDS